MNDDIVAGCNPECMKLLLQCMFGLECVCTLNRFKLAHDESPNSLKYLLA